MFPSIPLMGQTLLDEILEPKLFELKRRAQGQARSRAAAPEPAAWKCLHQRQSDWIPLDDPKFVYQRMIPGKTRLDDAGFLPMLADNVNVGVIGQDERMPWTNTLDRPYRWICKLGIAFQSRNGGVHEYYEGSGVLIDNRHVLTCAHNLFWEVFNNNDEHVDTLEARAVVVIPGLNGVYNDPKKALPFGWSWGSAFRTTTEAREFYCRYGQLLAGHDFAVVKLADDLGNRSYPVLNGARFGHWGDKSLESNTLMKFMKSKSMKGVYVNIMGYPGDRCRDRPLGRAITQHELDNCSASDWASVPWLSFDRLVDPGLDGEKFAEMRVEHDIAPGMSGGPVWIRWKGFRNMLGLARGVATDRRSNIVGRFTETALNEISSWIK